MEDKTLLDYLEITKGHLHRELAKCFIMLVLNGLEKITIASGSIASKNNPSELGHLCLHPLESKKASNKTPLVKKKPEP